MCPEARNSPPYEGRIFTAVVVSLIRACQAVDRGQILGSYGSTVRALDAQ